MDSLLPVPRTIYERAVLFDTGALEAITDRRDQYHQQAIECLFMLRRLSYPLYVTTLTISETYRRLLYKPYVHKQRAFSFLDYIYDGSVNIERPTEEDEVKAIGYVRRFYDQDITFTDAISMAIMIRLGIRKVFSFDRHFALLGFQIIPPLLS